MCTYVRACVRVDVYRKGRVYETGVWIVSSATPSLTIKTSGCNQCGTSINFHPSSNCTRPPAGTVVGDTVLPVDPAQLAAVQQVTRHHFLVPGAIGELSAVLLYSNI